MPPALLYAAYLDVVRYPANVAMPPPPEQVNSWSRRFQWIVLPKGPGSSTTSGQWVFYRVQESPTHKAIWRSNVLMRLDSVRDAWEREALAGVNSVGHDPIVVEITVDELASYTKGSGHTPWKVIERARRYTRKTRGYVI